MTGKREAVQAIGTYAALMVLLLISIGSLVLHLGALQPLLLLAVAAVQAILVILIFMRVRSSTKLIWLFAGGSFLWLSILLVIVFSDYISRAWWR
ncbi:MAG: caa(3)-type oxidase subunit IV [Verrucomicrobia bacterium]|nr:caa(3)-type oxidase subunit IV [Verrucomicrobiota bacterium]MBV9273197.1 caa(3)-type oxidase subunit IV [Verrucomicrobiota bacterium]